VGKNLFNNKVIAIFLVAPFAIEGVALANPEAAVTSDQIACQLAGDCQAATPPNRSFSIRRPASGSNAQATPEPANSRIPSAKVVPAPQRRGQASNSRFSIAQPTAGKVDLSINFVSGSATLSDSGQQLAQTFLRAIKSPRLTGKRFLIAGHTDASGSRLYNISLSKRRAQAFVDYLVGQGANKGQFDVEGYGFDRPLPGTPRSAAANRRVEVVVVK
jgi:OmpA-OmpF porin, OOP family